MQIRAENSTIDAPSNTERFGPQHRDWYLSLRRQYGPAHVRFIMVAESPPISGRYFYDPAGSVSEPLFRAIMQCRGLTPATKEAGLRNLREAGWILVDSTYEAVNALSGPHRDEIIIRDYPLLREDVLALVPDRQTPLILIKANVCRLLEPRLREEGFNVLNRGRAVYFPSHGRQNEFQQQISTILKSVGGD